MAVISTALDTYETRPEAWDRARTYAELIVSAGIHDRYGVRVQYLAGVGWRVWLDER